MHSNDWFGRCAFRRPERLASCVGQAAGARAAHSVAHLDGRRNLPLCRRRGRDPAPPSRQGERDTPQGVPVTSRNRLPQARRSTARRSLRLRLATPARRQVERPSSPARPA